MRLHRSLVTALAAASLLASASLVRAQCLITGPTQFCPSGVRLCANTGGGYEWTGPNGFTASTQCISVTTPGVYSLRVFDANFGLWFGPCSQAMVAAPPETCGIAPPPPPNDTLGMNCPRAAVWWARQCGADSAHRVVSKPTLVSIAACVDGVSDLFVWGANSEGLCSALAWNDHFDARKRTERQFAAVLTNLCAAKLHVMLPDSTWPGLNPATHAQIVGGGTILDWAHATDAQLVALRAGSLRDSTVRRAYARIYATAWMLDHGVGIGPTCKPVHQRADDDAMAAESEGGAGGSSGAESPTLADAMAAMLGLDAVLSTPAPNPSRGVMSIAFSVADANGAEVRLAVYDLAGRQIRTLASGQFAAGLHDVMWDGRSDRGQSVRAGVYFISGRVGVAAVSRSILRVE